MSKFASDYHPHSDRRYLRMLLPFVLLLAAACEKPNLGALPPSSVTSDLTRYSEHPPPRSPRAEGIAMRSKERPPRATIIEGTGEFVNANPPRIEREPATREETATVNLVSVPVADAAKSVLGDLLGVKYVIDPAVKGELTIQTPKPVPRSTILDLFQAALRTNNAALIDSRGIYKIVPLDQTNIGAPIKVGSLPVQDNRPGSAVHIVPLKYVTPSEMQRVIEPLSPRAGIVRADDTRSHIILAGSPQEIASMIETISIFDVDVMKGMSFAIVPLKSAQPAAIVEELKFVFGSGREGPMSGMVRFLPNARLRAILIISPRRQYLMRAETLIRKLDAQAEGTERQFFTYSVQNRRAQDLVAVLQSMFIGEANRRANTPARNVVPNQPEATVASNTPPGASPNTMPSLLNSPVAVPGNKPGGAAPQRPGPVTASIGVDEQTGEARIRVAADAAKNALLIEASPADYRRVMRVVATLDVIPNQVLIEATIAEISLNDDLKLGLRWFFKNKNQTQTFSDVSSGALGSVFPGFSYALTAANVAATLNTLNTITNVNVVSSPSLTVMDNSTATLQIGDQVPITTQSASSVLVGGGVVNSVSYRDTGVILSITPRINESGRVLLDIEQEVSTVASTTSSNIDSPTIRQRRIRTSVLVNDGEALTLGGMIQDSKNLSRNQTPILGDIPVLGNIFKNKDNAVGKTELIILITPHVIRNFDEAARVTEEYRRALALDRPRQPAREESFRNTLRRTLE